MCVFLKTCHQQNGDDANAILNQTVLLPIRQSRGELQPGEEKWNRLQWWRKKADGHLNKCQLAANNDSLSDGSARLRG